MRNWFAKAPNLAALHCSLQRCLSEMLGLLFTCIPTRNSSNAKSWFIDSTLKIHHKSHSIGSLYHILVHNSLYACSLNRRRTASCTMETTRRQEATILGKNKAWSFHTFFWYDDLFHFLVMHCSFNLVLSSFFFCLLQSLLAS